MIIIIISGKDPLSHASGYAVYAYGLSRILAGLKHEVHLFYCGDADRIVSSRIGILHEVKCPLRKRVSKASMIGLLPYSTFLARAIQKYISTDEKMLVWGIGPWSLAGAWLKLRRKKIRLISYYPTSIRHEFDGGLEAISNSDYGIGLKVKMWIADKTIIPFYSFLEKLTLSQSNSIVVHYKSAIEILRHNFKIPLSRLILIPSLPETNNIVRKYIKPHKTNSIPRILLICRHDLRKGINILLHGFKLLDEQGVKYKATIIGDGILYQTHVKLAQKLGLTQVELMGFVKDTDPYLREAGLYVFPSFEEGSGSLSLDEAMKYGLPIVSTNVDGIPEDLTHEKSALLVPPGDAKALGDAMIRLLSDSKLAKRLGSNARKSLIAKNQQQLKIHVDNLLFKVKKCVSFP